MGKELGMPIGQARKLVWHLHGSMAPVKLHWRQISLLKRVQTTMIFAR